jgi:hypothetical protein
MRPAPTGWEKGRMLAAIEVTSGFGLVISILVLGALFIAWIISLFLLVGDSISVVAKIIWFVFLTCLAPIAIPVYLILRHNRRTAVA